MKDNSIKLVDIGASGGLHPRWESLGNKCEAVLFDPDARAISQLTEKTNNEPSKIIIPSALYHSHTEVELYLTKNQECSSVLNRTLIF